MKILQLVSNGGLNGVSKYAVQIIQLLTEFGHSVTPVCPHGSWLGDELDRLGLSKQGSRFRRWPSGNLTTISRFFFDGNYDLVHTHNSRAHNFGVLLRLRYRIPIVATAHQRHLQLHWPFHNFVVANSEATRKFHQRVHRLPDRKLECVYCPIDTDSFAQVNSAAVADLRESWGIRQDDLLLGTVGNVIPRKNQLMLLKAMPSILKRVRNAKLAIVGMYGSTYADACRRAIVELGIEHAVRWIGFESRMPLVMNALDLCVCAPREEAFGLTAAESLAARVPVVATAVGGLPEIVLHDENGLLVPPNRPGPLADAVCQLLLDFDRRLAMGRQGQQRVAELFSIDRHVSRIEAIYERVATSCQKNRVLGGGQAHRAA